jgi:histidine triad (HIT) family protein
MSLLAALVCLV